jgi:D-alanyl-lipoteichoic acid acyltransferase DltB (MBOAT superfamily)
MNLAEPTFLFFLAALVPLAAWASSAGARAAVGLLLLANAVFYAAWNPAYLLPLLATAACDYHVARALGRVTAPRARRALLALSLTVDLSLLLAFKYFDALAAGLGLLTGAEPGWRLVFMTGISFYTFQSLGYVLDVYHGHQAPAASFARYAAFVSFFPTLLAGPITRASKLLPQLERPLRVLDPDLAGRGLLLIACGFAKKGLVADVLGEQLANRVFEQPLFYSSFEVLCGLYAYAVQLYCDFSGYTDIALGAALLLGVQLDGNFRSPYRAVTLADFWQRWHISFSRWLREYVYFSVPGSKRAAWWPYAATLVTFALGGLWHGATWGFVIWGLIHGTWLCLERRLPALGRVTPRSPAWRRALGALLTFHVVLVGWVFFRAESLERVGEMASRLGDLTTGAGNVPPLALALIVVVLAAQWLPERFEESALGAFVRLPSLAQAVLLALVALAVRWAAGSSVAPFIYQGF